jgi:hypothetical protein
VPHLSDATPTRPALCVVPLVCATAWVMPAVGAAWAAVFPFATPRTPQKCVSGVRMGKSGRSCENSDPKSVKSTIFTRSAEKIASV